MKEFIEKLKENKKLTFIIIFLLILGVLFITSTSSTKKKRKVPENSLELKNPEDRYTSLFKKKRRKQESEVRIEVKEPNYDRLTRHNVQLKEEGVYLKNGKLYKNGEIIADRVAGTDSEGNYVLEDGTKLNKEGAIIGKEEARKEEKKLLPGSKDRLKRKLEEKRRKKALLRQKQLEEQRKKELLAKQLRQRQKKKIVKAKKVVVKERKPRNSRERYAVSRAENALQLEYLQVKPQIIKLPEEKKIEEKERRVIEKKKKEVEKEVILPGTQLLVKFLSGAIVSASGQEKGFVAEVLYAFGPNYEIKDLEGCFLTGKMRLDPYTKRAQVEADYLSCEDRVGNIKATGRDVDMLQGLSGKYRDYILERVAIASISAGVKEGASAMAESQIEEATSNVNVEGKNNQINQDTQSVAKNVKDATKYAVWSGISAGTDEIYKELEKEKQYYVPTLKVKPGKVGVFSVEELSNLTYLN